MKKFQHQMKFYRDKINLELRKYFNRKINEAKKIAPFCKDITESLANYTLRGGKRVRALLFIYAYKAITGIINEKIIKSSLSMELVQSAFLIHDDIMDRDDLRRGGPTIHKEYGEYLINKDLHFGESAAIIIGDLAFNFAYEIINNSNFALENRVRAIRDFLFYSSQVDFGQSLDILTTMEDKCNKSEISKIHRYKTGTYTGQLPILLGATLAGATKKQKLTLDLFARKLGEAFQVQDDIEGTFGEPSETGKPADSDIREGKKTLLIFQALKKASHEEQKLISACLGNEKARAEDIQLIRKIIYKTGSLRYSVDRAERLIGEAIKIIKPAKIDSVAKEFLINLAKYILTKDKIVIPE